MGTNTAVDVDALRSWIGRTETQWDHVTVPAVQRLAALLDCDDTLARRGDILPAGWHAILFPRVVRQSQVGPDGHPRRGDFLPPVPLPRRMFAGRRTLFRAPLQVGDEVRKDSTIANVTFKEGRSGPMVFVTVRGDIYSERGLAVTEEQDIVYRAEEVPVSAASGARGGDWQGTAGSQANGSQARSQGAGPQTGSQAAASQTGGSQAAASQTGGSQAASAQAQWTADGPLWQREIVADEVMLFRYSALTYNGHRIHYDLPYATGVERYPALVVNGGLVTLLLYELLRSHASAPVLSMSSRNMRPLFAGRPMRLEAQPAAAGALLRVLDASAAVAIAAQVEWAQ